jgi:hypothetical protein
MTSFFDQLGIHEVPAAMEAQKKLAEQAVAKPTRKVTKGADNSKISYTPRDHDTLMFIIASPVLDPEEAEELLEGGPRYCEVSNSKLAFMLGMSAGAAAARVSRLVKMGVIKPWYDVAVETGKVNRRVLEILQVPPTPWSPE